MYLKPVDELGEGDIIVMPKHVEGLEVTIGCSILELDTNEVAHIRRSTSDELDYQGRSVVGYKIGISLSIRRIEV